MRNTKPMSRTAKLKKQVEDWAKAKGRDKALIALIKGGFSVSISEKLIGGRYTSELRSKKADVLAKIMAKDGFELAGKKAS